MTTGQLVFYSGLVLLGLTIITAIIFVVNKPKYTPENAVYSEADGKRTQKLRSGYPTDRLTARREQPVSSTEAEPIFKGTIPLESEQGTAVLPAEQSGGTVPLTPGTERLPQEQGGTVPLTPGTERLSQEQGGGTVPLTPGTERLSQEQGSGTALLTPKTEKLSREQDGGTTHL